MRIAVDWDFADANVPGNPVSALVGSGVVGFGEPRGEGHRGRVR